MPEITKEMLETTQKLLQILSAMNGGRRVIISYWPMLPGTTSESFNITSQGIAGSGGDLNTAYIFFNGMTGPTTEEIYGPERS